MATRTARAAEIAALEQKLVDAREAYHSYRAWALTRLRWHAAHLERRIALDTRYLDTFAAKLAEEKASAAREERPVDAALLQAEHTARTHQDAHREDLVRLEKIMEAL